MVEDADVGAVSTENDDIEVANEAMDDSRVGTVLLRVGEVAVERDRVWFGVGVGGA